MKNNISNISKLNIILFVGLALVISVRLYVSDTLTTAGTDYSAVREQYTRLEKENEHLQNQYLSYTSLHAIEERAQELGYDQYAIDYLTPLELASR